MEYAKDETGRDSDRNNSSKWYKDLRVWANGVVVLGILGMMGTNMYFNKRIEELNQENVKFYNEMQEKDKDFQKEMDAEYKRVTNITDKRNKARLEEFESKGEEFDEQLRKSSEEYQALRKQLNEENRIRMEGIKEGQERFLRQKQRIDQEQRNLEQELRDEKDRIQRELEKLNIS